MKNKWKLTAIVTSASLLMCACATGTEQAEENKTQTEVTEEVVEEVNEHQANLDAINPLAYSNVDGLNLEPGTYISLIGKSSEEEYWKAIEEGAKQAVDDINEQLGYEGSDKVRIVYSGPSTTHDVDEQINILDEELARYPHALAIALVDSTSCGVQFDLATQNGIPIVTFDAASEYQGVMARVQTNNTSAAAETARQLAAEMGDTGEVMVFMHDSKSATSLERETGFVQELQNNHPGITVNNIYYKDKFDELKTTIAAEVNTGTYEMMVTEVNPEEEVLGEMISDEEVYHYIFAKNPEVDAIYATDSAAVMTMLEHCEEFDRTDVKIVGFGANEAQVQALEEGKLTGLLVQNPYGMGYATVVACARSILNEGNEALVDSGYLWINQENIKEEAVQNILY